jgi:hypothetical protein
MRDFAWIIKVLKVGRETHGITKRWGINVHLPLATRESRNIDESSSICQYYG